MCTLNAALFVVFFSRGIYDVALQTSHVLPPELFTVGLDGQPLFWGLFLLYCFWEVLPVTILLAFTWVSQVSMLGARERGLRDVASGLADPLMLEDSMAASDDSMADVDANRFVSARRMSNPSGPLTVPGGREFGPAAGFPMLVGGGSLQSHGSFRSTPGSLQAFDNPRRYDSPPVAGDSSGSGMGPVRSGSAGGGGGGGGGSSSLLRHGASCVASSASPANYHKFLSPRDILLGLGTDQPAATTTGRSTGRRLGQSGGSLPRVNERGEA